MHTPRIPSPPFHTERKLLPAYLPRSEASDALMHELLLHVAGRADRITSKELSFLGRSLVLPEYVDRCAKVSFSALCGEVDRLTSPREEEGAEGCALCRPCRRSLSLIGSHHLNPTPKL